MYIIYEYNVYVLLGDIMLFKNPQNGYVKESSVPWLWTLLFGLFYFMYKGIWAHVGILFLFSCVAVSTECTAISYGACIAYAFFANTIVRNHYLSKGWVEITDSVTPTDTTN